MYTKNNTKQRYRSIQGLRSFKDTLPKNIKKIISKKGYIFSETLNNWKYIVGQDLFKICYPKSFKHYNKLNVSYLEIMVKRGHEIDVEYSKKHIIEKMNIYFGYTIVEKLKLISFDSVQAISKKSETQRKSENNNKYINKVNNIKNDKIKKSLMNLAKVFKKK